MGAIRARALGGCAAMRQPLGKGGEMRPFRAEQASAALCDGPEGYVGQRCESPCDTCGCSGAALCVCHGLPHSFVTCRGGELRTRRRRRSLLDTWNYLLNKMRPCLLVQRGQLSVGPPDRRRRGHLQATSPRTRVRGRRANAGAPPTPRAARAVLGVPVFFRIFPGPCARPPPRHRRGPTSRRARSPLVLVDGGLGRITV